jgi:hypothetical protein
MINTLTSPVRQASPYVRPVPQIPVDTGNVCEHEQESEQLFSTHSGKHPAVGCQACERPASAVNRPPLRAASPHNVNFYEDGHQRPASAKVCYFGCIRMLILMIICIASPVLWTLWTQLWGTLGLHPMTRSSKSSPVQLQALQLQRVVRHGMHPCLVHH